MRVDRLVIVAQDRSHDAGFGDTVVIHVGKGDVKIANSGLDRRMIRLRRRAGLPLVVSASLGASTAEARTIRDHWRDLAHALQLIVLAKLGALAAGVAARLADGIDFAQARELVVLTESRAFTTGVAARKAHRLDHARRP